MHLWRDRWPRRGCGRGRVFHLGCLRPSGPGPRDCLLGQRTGLTLINGLMAGWIAEFTMRTMKLISCLNPLMMAGVLLAHSAASLLAQETTYSDDLKIIATQFSDWDVPVARINVAEPPYQADSRGINDATDAIQKAINDCSERGGGTVHIPAGYYRINGRLTLDGSVTLRGDWKKPTVNDRRIGGTVLNMYYGKGSGTDEPEGAIEVSKGGGIRDLSFYYPEQRINNPFAYPYLIKTEKMAAIFNISIVNAYRGIFFDDADAAQIRNVYGYVIEKGMRLRGASAIPRVLNINLAPEFWAQSGMPNSPKELDIMNNRSATSIGIHIESSDNLIVNTVYLSGYHTGMFLGGDSPAAISNGKLLDYTALKCTVGIWLKEMKAQGWTFTGGAIQVSGQDAVGIKMTSTSEAQFNSFSVESTGKAVSQEDGMLGFVQCDFKRWGPAGAIVSTKDMINISGNRFSGMGMNGPHIVLDSGVTSAVIFGNEFTGGGAKIINRARVNNKIQIDTSTKYAFKKVPLTKYRFAPRPLSRNRSLLINVMSFGAKADGLTDNTKAVQAALDKAGSLGGATVLIPDGIYRFNGALTVPEGVELRGIQDLPFVADCARTILLSYGNKENPEGPAFISLSAGSGVRGLFIYRPEQSYDCTTDETVIYKFPPLIRALGSNCWVVNTINGNGYVGVDFGKANTGGHYLDSYFSSPIHEALIISGDGKASVVENMQTNPVFWRRVLFIPESMYLKYMSKNDWSKIRRTAPTDERSPGVWPRGTAARVVGHGSFLFMGNFYNLPFKGYLVTGKAKALFLLTGGEGDNFFEVTKSVAATSLHLLIVGNSYHPIKKDGSFGFFDLGNNDQINLFNNTSFNEAPIGYKISGGNLTIQQETNVVASTIFLNALNNSRALVEGSYLRGGATASVGTTDASSRITYIATLSPPKSNFPNSGNVSFTGCSPSVDDMPTTKTKARSRSAPAGRTNGKD